MFQSHPVVKYNMVKKGRIDVISGGRLQRDEERVVVAGSKTRGLWQVLFFLGLVEWMPGDLNNLDHWHVASNNKMDFTCKL